MADEPGEDKEKDPLLDQEINLESLEDAISYMGFGPFQRRVWILCGMGNFVEAVEISMLSLLYPLVKATFELQSDLQLAPLASATYTGMLFGAVILGRLSDRVGRKPVFMWSLMLSSVFGLISAVAPSMFIFTILRGFLGVGYGGNIVTDTVLLAEFLPMHNRGFYLASLDLFFGCGAVLIVCLCWLLVPVIGWRYVVALSTIPAFILIVFRQDIPESPRFLLTIKGDVAQAIAVLRTMDVDGKLSERQLAHLATALERDLQSRRAAQAAAQRDLIHSDSNSDSDSDSEQPAIAPPQRRRDGTVENREEKEQEHGPVTNGEGEGEDGGRVRKDTERGLAPSKRVKRKRGVCHRCRRYCRKSWYCEELTGCSTSCNILCGPILRATTITLGLVWFLNSLAGSLQAWIPLYINELAISEAHFKAQVENVASTTGITPAPAPTAPTLLTIAFSVSPHVIQKLASDTPHALTTLNEKQNAISNHDHDHDHDDDVNMMEGPADQVAGHPLVRVGRRRSNGAMQPGDPHHSQPQSQAQSQQFFTSFIDKASSTSLSSSSQISQAHAKKEPVCSGICMHPSYYPIFFPSFFASAAPSTSLLSFNSTTNHSLDSFPSQHPNTHPHPHHKKSKVKEETDNENNGQEQHTEASEGGEGVHSEQQHTRMDGSTSPPLPRSTTATTATTTTTTTTRKALDPDVFFFPHSELTWPNSTTGNDTNVTGGGGGALGKPAVHPHPLPAVMEDAYAAALVMSVGDMAGSVLLVSIVQHFDRRNLLRVGLLFLATIVIILGQIRGMTAILIMCSVFAAAKSGVICMLYTYTPEVYPTEVRSTGLGLCSAVHRLAPTMGHWIAAGLLAQSFGLASAVFGMVYLAAAFTALFLRHDTKDRELGAAYYPAH